MFVRSLVWVVLYRLGLWILPFRLIRKWTVGYIDKTAPRIGGDQVAAEIVKGVRSASRYVPGASCLTQALAARKLLSHHGQESELKIGVAKSRGDFEAHAWLEIDGRIVLGKQRMHSRYVVLGTSETLVR